MGNFKSYTNLSFYEKLWGVLFVIFMSLGVYVANYVIDFQTNPYYNSIAEASRSDLFIIIPIAIITWIYRDLFTYVFRSKLESYIDKNTYPVAEERKQRSLVLCKWVLDLIYYSAATLLTYFIMKDSDFFPPALLGKGDISMLYDGNFPKVVVPKYLKEMQCAQMGFHLYSFVHQIVRKKGEKKFMEFLLHHGMTLILIAYSYCTNFVVLGSIILLVHDASDALLVFARSYAFLSFKYENISTLTYVSAIVFWMYTRLYAFPMYGIWPTCRVLAGVQGKYRENFMIMTVYMLSMVGVLFFMHIYWTYYMFKALFNYLNGNKMKADYGVTDKKKVK